MNSFVDSCCMKCQNYVKEFPIRLGKVTLQSIGVNLDKIGPNIAFGFGFGFGSIYGWICMWRRIWRFWILWDWHTGYILKGSFHLGRNQYSCQRISTQVSFRRSLTSGLCNQIPWLNLSVLWPRPKSNNLTVYFGLRNKRLKNICFLISWFQPLLSLRKLEFPRYPLRELIFPYWRTGIGPRREMGIMAQPDACS